MLLLLLLLLCFRQLSFFFITWETLMTFPSFACPLDSHTKGFETMLVIKGGRRRGLLLAAFLSFSGCSASTSAIAIAIDWGSACDGYIGIGKYLL